MSYPCQRISTRKLDRLGPIQFRCQVWILLGHCSPQAAIHQNTREVETEVKEDSETRKMKFSSILTTISGSQHGKLCSTYLTVGISEKPTQIIQPSLDYLSAECFFVLCSSRMCEEQLNVSVEAVHA